MISYYKYTNGESFTLDEIGYTGFFNVVNGIARTGKISSQGKILTPRDNFISEFYLKGYEFDTTYGNVSAVAPYYSNSFDLFNKQELDSIFSKLNHNNLIIFKNLVLQYPKVFNIENSQMHFYGLSATSVDGRNDDDIYGKTVYTQIDPFSNSSQWSFLDNINNGSFIVDARDNFLYFMSESFEDVTYQKILSGNFTNSSPLALIESKEATSINYHFDDNNQLLYIINQNNIEVYDTSNYPSCQNFILTDDIPISASRVPIYKWNTVFENWDLFNITWDFQFQAPNTDIIPAFIRIGNSARVEMNKTNIFLLNRNSTEIYSMFTLDELGIGEVQSLDIRSVDDYTIIIHKKDNTLYFTGFDALNVKATLNEKVIGGIDTVDFVTFSASDSNLFYIANTTTLQTRTITYPTQPVGTIDYSDLLYLKDYIFDLTKEKWENIQIKWDSNELRSNYYNNLVTNLKIYNDSLYVMLHNVGRIYTIKYPLNEQYLTSVPLNITKSFKNLTCSDSSIGLYLNNSLISIIKDVISLYVSAKYKFRFDGGYPITETIENLEFETKNLFLNGNETINVVSIQRILSLITEIQSKLSATTS